MFEKTHRKEENREEKRRKHQKKGEESQKNEKSVLKWYHFFSKYMVIGTILILFAIILDLMHVEHILVDIFVKLLETIGIALLIGSIFDFSKNSDNFLDLVSNILYQIVVSKEFLKKLGEDDKKQALELILRPSSEQLEKCGNIDDYFKKGIDNSMGMFDIDFKTNLVITAEAVKENGKVIVKGVMSNRVYRIKEEYSPIYTTFEREGSSITNTTIIHPEGENNPTLVENKIAESDINEKGQIAVKYEMRIPEDLQRYPYLTIKREFVEEGFDHWTNFHWTSLTPCDGIVFHLKCGRELSIKDYLIFDNKKLYDVDLSVDRKNINIISVNWLNSYTGFTLTISDNGSEVEKNDC